MNNSTFKKLILFELLLLFLATTFISDSPPPGWYQQSLPVNDQINDIYFTDTLQGWIVTQGHTNNNDTAYIMRTINGGINWQIQFNQPINLTTVFFTDSNTGYVGGGSGNGTKYMFKTTNSGINWYQIIGTFAYGVSIDDIQFIDNTTGWHCDKNSLDGGLYKTTNGGINWQTQLGASYSIKKLFFINKDTGWAGSSDWKLYRTTNGGLNWNLQFTSIAPVESIFFLTSLKGWIRGGTTGSNGVAYTTDGGFNWINSTGNTSAGFDLRFVNDSIGYSGMQSYRIPKSTDGGKTWGYQTSPIQNNMSIFMFKGDTLKGWAGGTGLVNTTDGGGPIIYTGIKPSSTFAAGFELHQNYPNPFNPSTTIEFEIKKPSKVSLKIYDIKGELVDELLDYERFSPGEYYVDFNPSSNFSSGVYLYQMTSWSDDRKEIFIDTKKMILIK